MATGIEQIIAWAEAKAHEESAKYVSRYDGVAAGRAVAFRECVDFAAALAAGQATTAGGAAVSREVAWTAERPTRPGWYWYRVKPDIGKDRWLILEVVRRSHTELGVWDEPSCYCQELPSGEWAGPIPEPV